MPPSLLGAFAAATAELIRREEALHSLQPQASDCVKQMQFARAYGASQSRLSMTWTTGHLLHGSGFTGQVLARRRPWLWARTIMLKPTAWYYPSLMRERYISEVVMARSTTRPAPTNPDGCQSTLVQHTARPASLQAIDLSILRQRFRP